MTTPRIISDIHLSPGEEYPATDLHGPLILNGDTFNILPYGVSRWRTAAGIRTVNSLTDCMDDDAVFVLGNHEGRLAWLRNLVPDFECVRYYDFEVSGQPFRSIHGHQFAGDWTILRHFAPDAVELLTSLPVVKGLWWKFSQRMGWMGSGNTLLTCNHAEGCTALGCIHNGEHLWRPGSCTIGCRDKGHQCLALSGMQSSNDKYVPFVGSVWAWALKEANRQRRHLIIGHTHQPARLQPEGFYGVIDCGANQVISL